MERFYPQPLWLQSDQLRRTKRKVRFGSLSAVGQLFELYRYYSWIIDRFHISTQMWQAIYRGRRYQFEWLESRLAALGFRLVFCWRDPSSFPEARERRMQVTSNPSQYDDLTLFIREQKVLQELVKKSVIPSLTVRCY